ncbi:hypothetical protein BXY66_3346 [Shimia isoporae]|uniref:Uncharacterized protein n=1 Tax=Shimia isoporae TaxID=647720 RepID=A0A4R1N301_9RHOB|nr:hypothetical protein [Shimia isoporae]TCL00699.1 hypothetical protein BXY66_3346 [Shimia isoporae]
MTSKHFIGTILGLAMAVTGISAMPARALSNDDLAKLLFGATALVIIGNAVASDNDRDPGNVTQPRSKNVRRNVPPSRVFLPRRCSRDFTLRNGRIVQAYGEGCLNQARVNKARLPQACRFNGINQHGARISGYKTGCLQRRGYPVSWR